MHLTDGANNSAGQFVDRDLVTPTPGTQIEKHWLNMVQGEFKAILDDAGTTPVKGTWDQVLTSLRSLFVRATGAATQTITGLKTFTSKLVINASAQALEAIGGGSGAAVQATASSTGPAIKATVADPSAPAVVLEGPGGIGSVIRFGAFSTDGSFPSAPQPGDTVYLAGANDKLYTWDGATWNAHW
jgi:hypothetical protein